MGDVTLRITARSAMSGPTALSTGDLTLLTRELSDVTDPHKLGINLGINPAQVTILLKNATGDIERQKSNVLEHWLNNDLDASWPTLVKTLRNINHVALGDRLEKKYAKVAVTKGMQIAIYMYYINTAIINTCWYIC